MLVARRGAKDETGQPAGNRKARPARFAKNDAANRHVDAIAHWLLQPGTEYLSLRAMARKIGIARDTLARHLEAARVQAARWRQRPMDDDDLRDIDRAMVAQAKGGRVDAARLVFWRAGLLSGTGEAPVPPSEAELEAALALVRKGDG